MDRKPPPVKTLALEPVDVVKLDGGPDAASANAKGQRDLRMTTADDFLSKAAAEYEKGHVDQALWRLAGDQCGGDASLMVAAYLRKRAKALRLQHRQAQLAEIQARGASSTRPVADPKPESEQREEIVSTKFRGDRHRSSKLKLWHLAAVVAGIAATVTVVYITVSPPENASGTHSITSNAAPSPNQATPKTPLIGEQAVGKSAAGGTNPAGSQPTLAVTVQQLKSAGKWQLLVLNASEWTRREPGNAAAWSELGFGYARLGQFGDALDAATRAVQLSPGDVLFWRNLGHLDLELDRLPEAGIAFAKALAINPNDTDAQCGAASVAQRQAQLKDTETTVKRVKASDGSCPDAGDGGRAVVPAPARKAASAAAR